MLWQMETRQPVPTPYPDSAGIPGQPVWSPDTRAVCYTKGAPPNLHVYDMAGGSGERKLFETQDSLETDDWSPDGRYILYTVASANNLSLPEAPNAYLFPIASGGSPIPFRAGRFPGRHIQIAPNGKWIAYTSPESGQRDIFIEPFDGHGPRQRVSPKGGDYPRWRRDSMELFYVAADGRLMAAPITVTGAMMRAGNPEALFSLPPVGVATVNASSYIYDITADGHSFLIPALSEENGRQSVNVILNWGPGASAPRK